MNIRILDEAAAEFADAIARYESIESGLGVRLKQEVKSAVGWISVQPELPRVRPKGYRRLNLKVFPYYIAYAIHGGSVWVLASFGASVLRCFGASVLRCFGKSR